MGDGVYLRYGMSGQRRKPKLYSMRKGQNDSMEGKEVCSSYVDGAKMKYISIYIEISEMRYIIHARVAYSS